MLTVTTCSMSLVSLFHSETPEMDPQPAEVTRGGVARVGSVTVALPLLRPMLDCVPAVARPSYKGDTVRCARDVTRRMTTTRQ